MNDSDDDSDDDAAIPHAGGPPRILIGREFDPLPRALGPTGWARRIAKTAGRVLAGSAIGAVAGLWSTLRPGRVGFVVHPCGCATLRFDWTGEGYDGDDSGGIEDDSGDEKIRVVAVMRSPFPFPPGQGDPRQEPPGPGPGPFPPVAEA